MSLFSLKNDWTMFPLQVVVVEGVCEQHDEKGQETVYDLNDSVEVESACVQLARVEGNLPSCKA